MSRHVGYACLLDIRGRPIQVEPVPVMFWFNWGAIGEAHITIDRDVDFGEVPEGPDVAAWGVMDSDRVLIVGIPLHTVARSRDTVKVHTSNRIAARAC